MPVATSDALTGLGMPPQLAALIGGNPSALTTAGTTSGTAVTIKSKNTELVTAGSQTGAIFPSTVGVAEPYFITNAAATTGVVYVPTGHTFNLSGAPTSVNIAQFKSAIIWQYKPKLWTYLVLV